MPTNVRKNATFTTMVEGVLTDLMLKTTAAQVEVSEGVTLATKIQDLITAINGKSADGHIHATADVTGLDDKLATLATTEAMNTAISAAIDELIDGAPDTYDTLKEIATYITEHEDVVTALNAAIGNKADTSVVTALSDKVTALEGKAHEHANKNILDAISTEPAIYGVGGDTVYSPYPSYISAACCTDSTFNDRIEEIVYNKLGMTLNEVGMGNTTVGDKTMYLPSLPLIKYTAPDEFFDEPSLNKYGVTKKQMQSAMTDAITPLNLFLNVASKIADKLKNVQNDVKKIDSLGALASKDKVSTAELDEMLTAEVAKIHEHSNAAVLNGLKELKNYQTYGPGLFTAAMRSAFSGEENSRHLMCDYNDAEGHTYHASLVTAEMMDKYHTNVVSDKAEQSDLDALSEKVTALETASASAQKIYISATQPEGLKNGDTWFKLDE